MVLNFTLSDRVDAPSAEPFARNRTWYGWDPSKSPEEIWEANRGDWRLGGPFERETYVTWAYRGEVVLVGHITGKEPVDTPTGRKWAVTGGILPLSHPASIALMGQSMPSHRNPVAYVDLPNIDAIPVGSLTVPPTPRRPGWLLTWNPALSGFSDFEGTAEAVAEAGRFRGRWSTGPRKSGIKVGDRLFLLAVGPKAGIVGTAWAASQVFQDQHWDPYHGGSANYALIDWDSLVALDDRLDRMALRALLPGVAANWVPRASGIELDHDDVKTLIQAWADHIGDPDVGATIRGGEGPSETGGGKRGGQGYQVDAERRKKTEDAAQARLEQHYRDLGYEVQDVRFTEHYDALASKGNEVVYLEAKGTTTAGESVIVSKHEVKWARTHAGQCVMGLWSGIEFDRDGNVEPGKGVFRVFPWNPDAGLLTPRDFDWAPKLG